MGAEKYFYNGVNIFLLCLLFQYTNQEKSGCQDAQKVSRLPLFVVFIFVILGIFQNQFRRFPKENQKYLLRQILPLQAIDRICLFSLMIHKR